MSEQENNAQIPAPEVSGEVADEVTKPQVEAMEREVERNADRVNVVSTDEMIGREMSRRSRRNFLALGVATLGAYGGWRWLKSRPEIDGIPASRGKLTAPENALISAMTRRSPR
jgi:hypothetical protein